MREGEHLFNILYDTYSFIGGFSRRSIEVIEREEAVKGIYLHRLCVGYESKREPETFFSLDRPKEGVSEIRRYIWYKDDSSAVLYNGGSNYSTLTKEQTDELKNV